MRLAILLLVCMAAGSATGCALFSKKDVDRAESKGRAENKQNADAGNGGVATNVTFQFIRSNASTGGNVLLLVVLLGLYRRYRGWKAATHRVVRAIEICGASFVKEHVRNQADGEMDAAERHIRAAIPAKG